MDVISIATKKRQAIDDYRIHLRGDQRDEYPQVFTEIEVITEVTGRISRRRPSGARSSSRPRSTARSAR